MSKPLPPAMNSTKWHHKQWVIEVFSSFPPIVAAAVAAIKLYDDKGTANLGIVAGAGAIWLIFASILKIARAREQDEKSAQQYDGLKGALQVLHATAAHVCGLSPENAYRCLRITFHRVCHPVYDPSTIEQVVNYVGGRGDGVGRSFATRCGIAGKAVRRNLGYGKTEAFFGERKNEDAESFKQELEDNWGYAANEISTLSQDRFSWAAVPVKDSTGQYVSGVIYFDSTERSIFADPSRKASILQACTGVSTYINGRY